jgi:predicted ribosomally synthesized peptide with SipW-like signal peptide
MYEIGGRTSMKNKKRIITLGAAAVATIAVLGGTFAYFTGYDSKDLTAKAGTLTVELTDATEDLTNGLTVINPGDANPLTFTVSNTGEKSMDVKAVMKVSAPQAFTESAHEFKITDDKGTELTGVLSDDKQSITYTVTDLTLAGSVENDSTLDGTTDTSHKFDYKFAMDSGAKNAWQDVTGTVKIEVYAKQHRNTSSLGSDWVSIVEKN